MIKNVRENKDEDIFEVYDENDRKIFSTKFYPNLKLVGFTPTTLTVSSGDSLIIYDDKGNEIRNDYYTIDEEGNSKYDVDEEMFLSSVLTIMEILDVPEIKILIPYGGSFVEFADLKLKDNSEINDEIKTEEKPKETNISLNFILKICCILFLISFTILMFCLSMKILIF